jgi:hypothetical protein
MGRLLVAYVWRARWWYIVVCVNLALIWTWTGREFSLQDSFAASMLVAFYIGPILTFAVWPGREFASLPFSRAQLWRLRWLLAVAVPTTVTTAAKLAGGTLGIANGGPTAMSWSVLMMSAIWDAAYCGGFVGLGTIIAIPSRGRGPVSMSTGASVLFMCGTFAAVILRRFLASGFGEFGVGTVALLGSLLILSLVGYANPERFLPPVMPVVRRTPSLAGSQPRTGRLTGLTLLVVRDWTTHTITIAILFGIGFIGLLWLNGRAETFTDARSLLAATFDGNAAVPSSFRPFPMLFMVGYVFSVSSSDKRLRHLRTLPLGIWRLNATILSHTVIGWLTVWAAFISLHYVLLGPPETLRADLLCLFMGGHALSVAIQQRSRILGSMALAIWISLSIDLAGAPVIGEYAQPVIFLAALGAFASAIGINHLLLTRSSRIYKPDALSLLFARP